MLQVLLKKRNNLDCLYILGNNDFQPHERNLKLKNNLDTAVRHISSYILFRI